MPSERITFTGHSGARLAARLDLPEGPHLATAILAHCFTCSKELPAARRIAGRLASMGIAVLRFDFTGLGHSEGEFSNTSFTSNLQDLKYAAQYLSRRKMPPQLLIGHSLGGAAVLAVAADLPSIEAVATLGAPFDPAHVLHNFSDQLEQIATDGSATVNLGGRPFTIKQAFIEDIASQNLAQHIAKLGRPLLVLHAPRDMVVVIENATEIFVAAKHPESFVTLDDADHLISRSEDAEYAAQIIASWAARYIELDPPAPPIGAPEGVVRVSEADAAGFLQDINAGPFHHVLADEPLTYGGTNKGMSPYGFLAAGLGACTSVTLRMYARRKGWPLDHIWVDITHDKMHAQDAASGHCDKIDRFKRVIHLAGKLDQTQRERLLEIADRCPVHRTLERESKIETRLAP